MRVGQRTERSESPAGWVEDVGIAVVAADKGMVALLGAVVPVRGTFKWIMAVRMRYTYLQAIHWDDLVH